jgi:hypothetical protein
VGIRNQGIGKTLPPPSPFPLQLAIHLAFGLAQLARNALEGFLFVHTGFGLEAGYAVGDSFMCS